MPKKTFFNLKPEKKKEVTDAFLREFSVNTFDEASITSVVKQLGIAKGSVYQYFEDKRDLFFYLVGESTSAKKKYIEGLAREDFPDFWAYFRALYEGGFQFDNENPLESHFLHNLADNLNSPSIAHLYRDMLHQTVRAFEKMVRYEVEAGHFRDDISTETMGFMLYKVGISIQEQLEFSGKINPKKSIRSHEPVYRGKKETLMRMVNDYIRLVKPAFDKKTGK